MLKDYALRGNCPNTEKYGPEETPYLNTFHAVTLSDKENFYIYILIILVSFILMLSIIEQIISLLQSQSYMSRIAQECVGLSEELFLICISV